MQATGAKGTKTTQEIQQRFRSRGRSHEQSRDLELHSQSWQGVRK